MNAVVHLQTIEMAVSAKIISTSRTYVVLFHVGSQLRLLELSPVIIPAIKPIISVGWVVSDGCLIKASNGLFAARGLQKESLRLVIQNFIPNCQQLVTHLDMRLFRPFVQDQYTVSRQFSGHVDVQSGGASAINQRAHLRYLQYLIMSGRRPPNLDQHLWPMMMLATYFSILSLKIHKALGLPQHNSLLMPSTI
jgi:hypothetical protein